MQGFEPVLHGPCANTIQPEAISAIAEIQMVRFIVRAILAENRSRMQTLRALDTEQAFSSMSAVRCAAVR